VVAALSGDEARYYTVEHYTSPEGEVLEVGGLGFLADGRLALSTRRGEVWLVEHPLGDDLAEARFTRFAEGLWEGLGLAVVDDTIHVVQRGEISRLLDTDGDGRCDTVETLADEWGLSGNYHEFVYGLPRDDAGNFFVSLNVSFFSPEWWHGKSTVPYRGWVLRIDPSGRQHPFASGFRSPCGLGFDAAGHLLATDNQGDWMPASPIFHVQEGGFYGHPASLAWTPAYLASATVPSDRIPPREASTRRPAAVWLPYEWSRSPGNLVPDTTGGAFGPFEDQLFLAELTNGRLLRVELERVRGELQGAVFPFRADVGSACRVEFAPDGSLIVGLTNRGWGGRAPASGLARVRWTGIEPFEIEHVSLIPSGFQLDFTAPLDEPPGLDAITLRQYDYDYWWEYGSPERAEEQLTVAGVELSRDRRRLVLTIPDLVPAKVARVQLHGVVAQDGRALLHDEFAYTVNQLVDGPLTTEHVAKVVPPPAARESDEEGWLRLTWGDATDGWNFSGWELCDVALDPEDPTRLVTTKGVGALANTLGDAPTDYVSKLSLGSGTLRADFLLPEGGAAALLVQGRYSIDLPTGAVAQHTPKQDAYLGAGEWNELELAFEAPSFDADGAKLQHARLTRLTMNGETLLEDVELEAPSAGGDEAALGPLVLVVEQGHAAFGNLQFRPAESERPREGWSLLFDTDRDDPLEAWRFVGDAEWSFDDGVLTGTGRPGFLVSERDDYRDLELRGEVKISGGGNSGLFARARVAGAAVEGYEAEINSSFPDAQKTGSLAGLAVVRTHLVPEDTWFDYTLRVVDEPAGTRVQIFVNGVLVTEHLDELRRFTTGHLALQQHHEGSVVEYRSLVLREF
ncbi:MAG: family 16 glycoside hydrolase, partial [Planctomycetota bacterium]